MINWFPQRIVQEDTDKTQHGYWFITKNDCSGNLESKKELKERVERLSRQYVFQYERGLENNRLHYHLLIYLKVKMRFSALNKIGRVRGKFTGTVSELNNELKMR